MLLYPFLGQLLGWLPPIQEHEIKSAIIAAIWAVTNEVHDIETAANIATAQIMRELEKPTHVPQN